MCVCRGFGVLVHGCEAELYECKGEELERGGRYIECEGEILLLYGRWTVITESGVGRWHEIYLSL